MAKSERRLGHPSTIKRWAHRSGWFFILIAGGGLIYAHAMKQKRISYQDTVSKLHELEKQKAEATTQRDELLLQIQSQSDPAWVEMVLKRELGMTREGEVKAYFHDDP
jgi:hypothetical protein